MNQTTRTDHLHLPDGRELGYTIRTSPRSKYIRLRLTPREGLIVTAPKGISSKQLTQTALGSIGDTFRAMKIRPDV